MKVPQKKAYYWEKNPKDHWRNTKLPPYGRRHSLSPMNGIRWKPGSSMTQRFLLIRERMLMFIASVMVDMRKRKIGEYERELWQRAYDIWLEK